MLALGANGGSVVALDHAVKYIPVARLDLRTCLVDLLLRTIYAQVRYNGEMSTRPSSRPPK